MRYIFLALFILCSCAGVRVVNVNKQLAARVPCNIQLYTTRPNKPLEEIATLEGFGKLSPSSYYEMAKEKACELGGDAVLVGASTNRVEGGVGGVDTHVNTTFSVIKLRN